MAQPVGVQEEQDEYTIQEYIDALEGAVAEGAADDEGTQNLLSFLGYTFYHMPRQREGSTGCVYLNVAASYSVRT